MKKNKLFIIFMVFFSIECVAKFEIYDATLYKNKPILNSFNINSIPIIYETHFFGNNKNIHAIPDNKHIEKIVSGLKNKDYKFIVLDIERWPVRGKIKVVNESLLKYKKVIKIVREAGIKTEVGYYGMLPIRDFWRSIKGEGSKDYLSWKKENDILRTLADDVDVFYPSLYTFYSNKEKWKIYAIAQISEARRMAKNKPVIVFLWPEYHDSNMILKGNYIEKEFWRLQLDTVFKYADGLIIWGGWKQEWDSNAIWWKETIQFIKENNL